MRRRMSLYPPFLFFLLFVVLCPFGSNFGSDFGSDFLLLRAGSFKGELTKISEF